MDNTSIVSVLVVGILVFILLLILLYTINIDITSVSKGTANCGNNTINRGGRCYCMKGYYGNDCEYYDVNSTIQYDIYNGIGNYIGNMDLSKCLAINNDVILYNISTSDCYGIKESNINVLNSDNNLVILSKKY
jgi:hypothetical protein